MDFYNSESGYIAQEHPECYLGSAVHDVEIIRVTATNVLARGRRYGRQWFLKGLREDYRDSMAMRRRLFKEFELHSRLQHHNIVQAVGLEEIEGLGLCIIQEWLEGITLRDALRSGTLTSADILRVIRELTAAVAYLHRCERMVWLRSGGCPRSYEVMARGGLLEVDYEGTVGIEGDGDAERAQHMGERHFGAFLDHGDEVLADQRLFYAAEDGRLRGVEVDALGAELAHGCI